MIRRPVPTPRRVCARTSCEATADPQRGDGMCSEDCKTIRAVTFYGGPLPALESWSWADTRAVGQR